MSDHHAPSSLGRHGHDSEPVSQEPSLVRSREQLSVTTEPVAVAVARLTKFTVTEQRTITVDVSREDVRIVYDTPDRNSADSHQVATSGSSSASSAPAPAPDTVVLYAEEIDIVRRWVPIETARLDTTTVTSTETVTDTVRVEQIEVTTEDNSTI